MEVQLQSLVEAYNNTSYRVELPNEVVTLRPGNHCPALNSFLATGGWNSAAVITAFNPRSTVTSHEENVAANASLLAAAQDRGYEVHFGAGVGDDPKWGPEESFLLCGIALPEALALAVQFEQNAIAFHAVNLKTGIELTEILAAG
jgi:hypothetical protein